MNIEELQSKTLDYIRFPISIGVVFIHNSYGGGFVDMQAIDYTSLTSENIYDLFRVLTKTLATIATPYFFLISGYFYFRKTDTFNTSVYLSKTKNRVLTLLVPYFVWNFLAFFVPLCTSLVKGTYDAYISSFSDIHPLSIFWNYKYFEPFIDTNIIGQHIFETAPLNVPLWFLRDLFIISLLSPVVYYFIKYTKIYGVVILGLCYLLRLWPTITGFSSIAVFFFSLGAYLGINKQNLVAEARKHRYAIVIICIVAVILDTYTMGLPIHVHLIRQVYRFFGLLAVIVLASYLLERGYVKVRADRRVAKSSFFIYVAHGVSVLGVTVKVYSYFFQPDSPLLKAVVYMSISVTTVVVCYFGYVLLKRLLPKTLNIITGHR
ncbi:MAG: acyltransferase [Bacteroidales bacterium]|nr:acyltransferase [Bacteroidales bacterium]